MKFFLISDTHFNHSNMVTYCQRPPDFTELIIKNWNLRVAPEDTVIHLGDVMIGKKSEWIMPSLPGRKILIRGNHDRSQSISWWMEHGFDFACDAMMFRNCWLTHEPAQQLPWKTMEDSNKGLNIHGHLHNIWHGFGAHIPALNPGKLNNVWQRLFSIEYTNYCPIEFDEFISHPKKYLSTGLGD